MLHGHNSNLVLLSEREKERERERKRERNRERERDVQNIYKTCFISNFFKQTKCISLQGHRSVMTLNWPMAITLSSTLV